MPVGVQQTANHEFALRMLKKFACQGPPPRPRLNNVNRFKGWAMRRPTIREVARLAGVSVGTVSNVINGRVGVSRLTRAAVERAVADLEFTVNTFARSLPAQRPRKLQTPERKKLPRLTSAGYISVDYTARIDVLPHRDDRIMAHGIEKSLGGPAANVAVMAAGLQGRWAVDCELVTALGDDVDSDWALATLAARDVSTAGVGRRPGGRLSRCVVLVEPTGSRTIINEPFTLDADKIETYLRRTHMPGRRHCLHLEGYQVEALEGVVAAHRRRGGIASMNTTGISAAWCHRDGFMALARRFDVIILNREAAGGMVAFRGPDLALARRISRLSSIVPKDAACRLVVLTLGSLGAVVFESGTARLVPTPHVDSVDTTGAGDAFVGIFLAVWLNDTTTIEAARLATIAASQSTLVNGAQGLLLTADDLDQLADKPEYPDDNGAAPTMGSRISGFDLFAGAA